MIEKFENIRKKDLKLKYINNTLTPKIYRAIIRNQK
jgi:hypothetical protein